MADCGLSAGLFLLADTAFPVAITWAALLAAVGEGDGVDIQHIGLLWPSGLLVAERLWFRLAEVC